MSEQLEYRVPDMKCGHCEKTVVEAISPLAGVESVRIDLETKLVTVAGEGLDDEALRAAIFEAGYEVEA
ncbi:MAG: heavy-metal-associated domain-containing protein [Gaiellaceae bacterium]